MPSAFRECGKKQDGPRTRSRWICTMGGRSVGHSHGTQTLPKGRYEGGERDARADDVNDRSSPPLGIGRSGRATFLVRIIMVAASIKVIMSEYYRAKLNKRYHPRLHQHRSLHLSIADSVVVRSRFWRWAIHTVEEDIRRPILSSTAS